jgi:hypothetical protein
LVCPKKDPHSTGTEDQYGRKSREVFCGIRIIVCLQRKEYSQAHCLPAPACSYSSLSQLRDCLKQKITIKYKISGANCKKTKSVRWHIKWQLLNKIKKTFLYQLHWLKKYFL